MATGNVPLLRQSRLRTRRSTVKILKMTAVRFTSRLMRDAFPQLRQSSRESAKREQIRGVAYSHSDRVIVSYGVDPCRASDDAIKRRSILDGQGGTGRGRREISLARLCTSRTTRRRNEVAIGDVAARRQSPRRGSKQRAIASAFSSRRRV